jgi:hypothetical protein
MEKRVGLITVDSIKITAWLEKEKEFANSIQHQNENVSKINIRFHTRKVKKRKKFVCNVPEEKFLPDSTLKILCGAFEVLKELSKFSKTLSVFFENELFSETKRSIVNECVNRMV